VGYDSLLSGLAVSHVSEKRAARNFRTDLGRRVRYMQSGTVGGLTVSCRKVLPPCSGWVMIRCCRDILLHF